MGGTWGIFIGQDARGQMCDALFITKASNHHFGASLITSRWPHHFSVAREPLGGASDVWRRLGQRTPPDLGTNEIFVISYIFSCNFHKKKRVLIFPFFFYNFHKNSPCFISFAISIKDFLLDFLSCKPSQEKQPHFPLFNPHKNPTYHNPFFCNFY